MSSKNHCIVEENGDFSWRGPDGVYLIEPRIRLGTSHRKGAAFMAPLCGPMPEDPAYAGCKMSQHDFVRNMASEKALSMMTGEWQTAFPQNAEFRRFHRPGNDAFPWEFIAALRVHGSETTLHHDAYLRRPGTCRLDRPMPGMLGVHCYWRTGGMPFHITYADAFSTPYTGWLKTHPMVWPIEDTATPVVIKLQHGTIHLYLEEGYTMVVIWTDDMGYICVEPVTGLGTQFSSLCSGQTIRARFRAEFVAS